MAERIQGEARPPLELYRDREWSAILDVVQKVFDKLTFISELGNDLLKPRLNALLSGTSRAGLIDLIRRQHAAVDFDQILESLVTEQMSGFREESPEYYQLFKRLDVLAAAARPATSVALFVTGFGPVGTPSPRSSPTPRMQGRLHLAGDVAGDGRGGGGRDRHQRRGVHWRRIPGDAVPTAPHRVHGTPGPVAGGPAAAEPARHS